MWKSFVKLLWSIGMGMEERDLKNNPHKPKYDGQWINKAKRGDEDWQWTEPKTLRPYYVSVFNLVDDYVISVGFKERGNSIETVKCNDFREVEIATRYLKTYYECLGTVTTHSEVE